MHVEETKKAIVVISGHTTEVVSMRDSTIGGSGFQMCCKYSYMYANILSMPIL